MKKEEEISKIKQTAISLENNIDNHNFTFVFPSGNEDPQAQISQLNTELQMAERDRKKVQTDLETASKIIQAAENEASKYKMDSQNANAEIKSLKDKLKGNISLIQAKDIIWNDIISEMKSIWDFLMVVAEERSHIREFGEQVMTDRQKTMNRAILEKRFIEFINSKTDQDL